jgi:NAD-dependent dihydropyrimidine dehydrogenase PreA subunit
VITNAATAPNRVRNHQPTKGATASRAIPQVPAARERAFRTRSLASSARALWCSVGHSQEQILSINPLVGSGGGPVNDARRMRRSMAYVIAEPCIDTKDNSCVEVCPVDCIHPTPDEPDYDNVTQLYIDPEECIDCDACVEACPVDACFAEDQLPDEWQQYIQINVDYYKQST